MYLVHTIQLECGREKIVKVEAVGALTGLPYAIVYEEIRGDTLWDFLNDSKPNKPDQIVEELASTLNQMHGLSIPHCSLSARKVYTDTRGAEVGKKLKFFMSGFQHSVKAKSKTISADCLPELGDPCLAPEVYKTLTLNQATEAFRILTLEFLTGHISSGHVHDTKRIPSDVPKEMNKLMKECCNAETEQHPSMAAVWKRLRAINKHWKR